MDSGRRQRGGLEHDITAVLAADGGAMTPGQVSEALGNQLAYTTVMTVLARLHDKGLATRRRAGRTFAYRAVLDEDEVTARQMRRLLDARGDHAAVLSLFVGTLSTDDERVLADTDTLMVFGLDHLLSEQEAAPEEIAAIKEWLKQEGKCLLLAPHHDVGFTDDFAQRQVEYEHHGDRLVPRQQRFSQYTRSLMKALDVPVHNRWGLRPAVVEGSTEIAPLTGFRDLDNARLLDDVTTFNFHPHLPHYELTAPEGDDLRVLGRQRVDPNRPHPFTEAGNSEFNALIWMPPSGPRAGDIVLIDSTHFTTLFGGTDSLRNLWHNLATMTK